MSNWTAKSTQTNQIFKKYTISAQIVSYQPALKVLRKTAWIFYVNCAILLITRNWLYWNANTKSTINYRDTKDDKNVYNERKQAKLFRIPIEKFGIIN